MKPQYRKAVGLEYNYGSKGASKGDTAPLINIAADAATADIVVKVAERYGIPVLERPALARSLHAIGLDKLIPAKLYKAVAIILGQLDKIMRRA